MSLPLFRVKYARAGFDQPGHHVEDGDAGPWFSVSRSEAFFVEIAHDCGVREVLSEKLHHVHQREVFPGVYFEAQAIRRYAQTVRNVFVVSPFRWSF